MNNRNRAVQASHFCKDDLIEKEIFTKSWIISHTTAHRMYFKMLNKFCRVISIESSLRKIIHIPSETWCIVPIDSEPDVFIFTDDKMMKTN